MGATLAVALLAKYIFFDCCMDSEVIQLENEFNALKERSKAAGESSSIGCGKIAHTSEVKSLLGSAPVCVHQSFT